MSQFLVNQNNGLIVGVKVIKDDFVMKIPRQFKFHFLRLLLQQKCDEEQEISTREEEIQHGPQISEFL